MAGVARSGVARQAYELNAEFHAATSVASWTDLPLRWHYKDSLPALKTNTTSAVYVEDGYVAASSKSPSEFDCYTNGVGFSMRARPRGSLNGHDVYTDGSVDMWAYGAQLTDGGGAGLDQYGYVVCAQGFAVDKVHACSRGCAEGRVLQGGVGRGTSAPARFNDAHNRNSVGG